MNVKQDNQTKERNSDDSVHDTNNGAEPDVENTIEADDSPIASEPTTGMSPQTSTNSGSEEVPTGCEIKSDDFEVTSVLNDVQTEINDGSNICIFFNHCKTLACKKPKASATRITFCRSLVCLNSFPVLETVFIFQEN